MMSYILISALILGVFYTYYHFFLADAHCFNFNRKVLLLGLGASSILPLFRIPFVVKSSSHLAPLPTVPPGPGIPEPIAAHPQPLVGGYLPSLDEALLGIYVLISSILLIRFALQLLYFGRKIRTSKKIRREDFVLVLLPQPIAIHSFFSFIFVNEGDYREGKIDQMQLDHERAHIRQFHSLDNLLMELYGCFFWFNPLLNTYKKSIKINHEYLSDKEVLEGGHSPQQYQLLLLQSLATSKPSPLPNYLNFHLTKKRFQMMKLTKKPSSFGLQKLLLLPALLLSCFFLLKPSLQAQQAPPPPPEPPTPQAEAEVTPPPPPPTPSFQLGAPVVKPAFEEKLPTTSQLLAWQSSKDYGLWINGKKVSNEALKGKKPENFGWYFTSKLLSNAKNFGKHLYRVDLYSREYFDNHMSKEAADRYNRIKGNAEKEDGC